MEYRNTGWQVCRASKARRESNDVTHERKGLLSVPMTFMAQASTAPKGVSRKRGLLVLSISIGRSLQAWQH